METLTITPAKMTMKEKHELALAKCKMLLPNTQIRLTADEASLWLFNMNGEIYIGNVTSEKTAHRLMFKNKAVKLLVNPKGETIAEVQFLCQA